RGGQAGGGGQGGDRRQRAGRVGHGGFGGPGRRGVGGGAGAVSRGARAGFGTGIASTACPSAEAPFRLVAPRARIRYFEPGSSFSRTRTTKWSNGAGRCRSSRRMRDVSAADPAGGAGRAGVAAAPAWPAATARARFGARGGPVVSRFAVVSAARRG